MIMLVLPSNSGDRLLVLEFSENVRIRIGFHEHLGEFLFLIGRFVLFLSVVQQHVHFAD